MRDKKGIRFRGWRLRSAGLRVPVATLWRRWHNNNNNNNSNNNDNKGWQRQQERWVEKQTVENTRYDGLVSSHRLSFALAHSPRRLPWCECFDAEKTYHNIKLAKRTSSKIFFLVYMYQNEHTVTSLKPKYFSSSSSSSTKKRTCVSISSSPFQNFPDFLYRGPSSSELGVHSLGKIFRTPFDDLHRRLRQRSRLSNL